MNEFRRACVVSVLMILSVVAPTTVFIANRLPDTDRYVRLIDDLRRLREAEEALSRLVLQARAGDLAAYDPIVTTVNDLDQLIAAVREPVRRAGGAGAIEDYDKLAVERRSHIERFKSADAVFRNSLVYLPVLVRDVANRAYSRGDQSLAMALENWEDTVFLALYGKATEVDVFTALARIQEASAPEDLEQEGLLGRHATTLLSQGRIAQMLAGRVIELSNGDIPNQIYSEVVSWHTDLQHRLSTITIFLYGSALLAFMGIILAMIRVASTNRLLARRAAELQATTINLRHQIAERQRISVERDRLQTQLFQSQKMEAIGTLAGGLAHELNNMLMPILALTQLTAAAMPDDSPDRRRLDVVVVTARRARDLVGRMLSFSRHEASGKHLVDLADVVRESLVLLQPLVPGSINLTADIGKVPETCCDAGALQQVIVNLVTNAWHAIGSQPGEISVRLRASGTPNSGYAASGTPGEEAGGPTDGASVVLQVEDDGAGMAEETRLRIFEPFFTTKPVGEGTGLGLSVVHGIIAAHQGRISVASIPGRGTTFTIELPVPGGGESSRLPNRELSLGPGQGIDDRSGFPGAADPTQVSVA